jgi:hypothetical protein
LSIQGAGGFNSQVNLGGYQITNPGANPGNLYIGDPLDLSGYMITMDSANHTVQLGDSTPGGNVQTLNALTITDPLGGGPAGNAVVISPISAVANKISGLIATGGSLRLGSSIAASAVVNISDTGANTGTFQVGGNGGDPLVIQGGSIAPNNYSVIRPNVASAGRLYIGSSTTTNPTAIYLTDTATTISKLGGAPGTLLAAQTIAPAGSVVVPLPVGEGLYSIVGCGVGGTATAYTRQAQLSCIAYINSLGVCQMGGSASVDVGALGGTDVVTLQVNPTGTGMNLYNNGAQSLVSYQVSAFLISGAIPGVV